MLEKYADHAFAAFAVDYQFQFGSKLADAVDQLNKELKPSQANFGLPSLYNFGFPEKRLYFSVMPNRVMCQSLGLSEWRVNWKKHLGSIQAALRVMDLQKFSRIGFKVTAYLPLPMAHIEICRLMFGAFLTPLEEMDSVLRPLNDPLVQFQGECAGLNYTLILAAMSRRQSVENFRQTPGLEQFLSDRFTDAGIRDFQQRLEASDCLFFDVDVSRTEVPFDELPGFVSKALAEVDRMAEASVRQLQSKPPTTK